MEAQHFCVLLCSFYYFPIPCKKKGIPVSMCSLTPLSEYFNGDIKSAFIKNKFMTPTKYIYNNGGL